MRTLVFAIAVMLLVPCAAWAQTHAGDVTIAGDLNVGNAAAQPTDRQLVLQNSSSNAWTAIAVQNASTGYGQWNGFFFGLNNQNDARFGHMGNHTMGILTNNLQRLTVTAAGNVGIGEIVPVRKLVVAEHYGSNGVLMAFQDRDTGATWDDGFQIGLDASENAYIMNREYTNILFGAGGGGAADMVLARNGRLGIGTLTPATLLDVDGEATVNVLNVAGSDMAELFDVRAEESVPGMIVSIDAEHPGGLVLSSRAYDRAVAGIISGAGDLEPGMLLGKDRTSEEGSHPVSLSGRAYCYVDATKAPVQPGDLLTTSDVPGHAMKVIDYGKAQGAIIGKAMTPLVSGRGLVMVLVCLQ